VSTPTMPRCYRHPHREALVRCTRCDRAICPECMHEASVGFHCPDDVAEGRRTQRAPRNSVGSALRRSPPYVTGALLALNVAAYLATGLSSPHGVRDPGSSNLYQDWQLQPHVVYADNGYYRLLTAAFLHVSLLHIAVNMLSLVFVGPYLEREIGPLRFTAVYLLSALSGSAAVYAFGSPLVSVVGASGAIFGMLGACLVLVRQLGLDLQWLVGIIILNFVFTFSVSGISRLGHIGGFVTGALAGAAIGGLPTVRHSLPGRVQAAGLAGLFALIVVIVIARSATGVS
jgi:membrane associated rhomboid family serine protease